MLYDTNERGNHRIYPNVLKKKTGCLQSAICAFIFLAQTLRFPWTSFTHMVACLVIVHFLHQVFDSFFLNAYIHSLLLYILSDATSCEGHRSAPFCSVYSGDEELENV